MKEHWEQECAALRAEVAALQQQVRALAAQQMEGKAVSRWGASKSIRFVLLPLFVLLASGGVLYGQGAMDALFIDPSGKVGIGMDRPNATLDVAGTLNVAQKASLAATEVKGTLDVTQKTNLSDTTIKGSLTTDGNVGIGTPDSNGNRLRVTGGPVQVDDTLKLQNHLVFHESGVINWGNTGNLFFRTNKTKWDVGGYEERMMLGANGDLYVYGKLDVNGFMLGHNPLDRAFRDGEATPVGQSDSARARAILASKPDGTFMLAGPTKNYPNLFMFYWKSDGKYYRGWIGSEENVAGN